MKRIFLVAGESSGDMHGAALVRALRAARPDVQCLGIGGPRMAEAGMELLHDLASGAIMGFVEVVRHAVPLRRLFLDTVARLRNDPPDLLVLIDYPGFNIRLARAVQPLGVPVVYYISPQVWAWKRGRIHTLAETVRKMLVIFPFEEGLFRDAGLDCRYVGHPLLDHLPPCLQEAGTEGQYLVGLLPGSREQEIRRIAPIMAQTAALLLQEYPQLHFSVPCVNEDRARQLRHLLEGLPVDIHVGGMHDVLRHARCCMVASGTATLETALFEVPMVILYRVNPVSFALARLLVHVRHIGIVNIIAEREIVPEFIQGSAQPEKIAAVMRRLIDGGETRERMLADFRALKARLGAPGASQRAAAEILALLP